MADKRIGKYTIIGEIGRGAMGVVYKAVDPVIGRTVAIKTIRFDVYTQPELREEAQQRFLREARSAGNLSHPNIVTIYDVGEDEGMAYIAMEYIEGQSLEAHLASKKKYSLEESVRLILEVADGLDHAHRKGIVHRDVKPGNILIDADGRPRIVDFGIARVTASTLTHTSVLLGTPSYMSPEQVAGQKVDQRSDIFALGVILYEMLTMGKPFGGDTLTTVIYKIMNTNPPPMRTFDSQLPESLEPIVQKALAKNPEVRYKDCQEFIEDLKQYLSPEVAVTMAIPGRTGFAPKKKDVSKPLQVPSRRPLMIVLASMFAVIFIAAGAILLSRKGIRNVPHYKEEETSAKKQESKVSSPSQPIVNDAKNAPSDVIIKPKETETSKTVPKDLPQEKDQKKAVSSPESGKPEVQKKSEAQATVKDLKEEKAKIEKREPVPVLKAGESRPPKLIHQVDPIYPDLAKKARAQGKVVLEMTIGTDGRVEDVEVIKSIPLLDLAAIEAAKKRLYEPALSDGKPAKSVVQVTMAFSLGASAETRPEITEGKRETDAAKSFAQGKDALNRGDFDLAIQLLEEAQKLDPQNGAAKSALSLARKKKDESSKSQTIKANLDKATDASQRGDVRGAMEYARQILRLDPNHEQAKALIHNGTLKLAPGEIKTLVDQYVQSLKTKQFLEFYRTHSAPALYARLQKNLEQMSNLYEKIDAAASNIALEWKNARYPKYTIRASFSHIITGAAKGRATREALFEGSYIWTLEKADNNWIIVDLVFEAR